MLGEGQLLLFFNEQLPRELSSLAPEMPAPLPTALTTRARTWVSWQPGTYHSAWPVVVAHHHGLMAIFFFIRKVDQ
jgi:hypothetical protein